MSNLTIARAPAVSAFQESVKEPLRKNVSSTVISIMTIFDGPLTLLQSSLLQEEGARALFANRVNEVGLEVRLGRRARAAFVGLTGGFCPALDAEIVDAKMHNLAESSSYSFVEDGSLHLDLSSLCTSQEEGARALFANPVNEIR